MYVSISEVSYILKSLRWPAFLEEALELEAEFSLAWKLSKVIFCEILSIEYTASSKDGILISSQSSSNCFLSLS